MTNRRLLKWWCTFEKKSTAESHFLHTFLFYFFVPYIFCFTYTVTGNRPFSSSSVGHGALKMLPTGPSRDVLTEFIAYHLYGFRAPRQGSNLPAGALCMIHCLCLRHCIRKFKVIAGRRLWQLFAYALPRPLFASAIQV